MIVAHPYCKHNGECWNQNTYDWVADRLASAGLWYAVSPASWYNESGTLIVIGRADVLERVELPVGNDPQAWRDLRTARGWPPHIDWEIVEAMQLAREQVERNRLAQKAVDAEAEGDWQGALYWHCDTAYLDRTGGFHRQAREQIALAAQVASAHQGLDRSFCHFRNEKDRVAVCGQGAAKISRPELQRRLDKASLPREWDRFFARESHEADVGIPGFGNASILQGGPLRYWMARVESKDGPGICTVKDEEPASLSSPKNYSCPTPEGAVAAAVDIWRRYDQLVGAI